MTNQLDCIYTQKADVSEKIEQLNPEHLGKVSLSTSSLFIAHMPDGEIDFAIPYKEMGHTQKGRNYTGNIFFKKYHLVNCHLEAISDSVAYELGRDFPPMTTFRGVEPLLSFIKKSKDFTIDSNTITTAEIQELCRQYNKTHSCYYM